MPKNYSLVIWDLDGTLLDTAPGIIADYNATARLYGKPSLSKKEFGLIGGSPIEGFKDRYGLSYDEAVEATKIYRQRYKNSGIFMFDIYPGIENILIDLKKAGIKSSVCTLKLDEFAKKMLKSKNLDSYFDSIYGVDQNDKLKKADLLNMCLEELNIEKNAAVLIGDSNYDANGAREAGIDFIGVTYGYGYKTISQIKSGYNIGAVSDAMQIRELIVIPNLGSKR